VTRVAGDAEPTITTVWRHSRHALDLGAEAFLG
jgi:hypothetical protein